MHLKCPLLEGLHKWCDLYLVDDNLYPSTPLPFVSAFISGSYLHLPDETTMMPSTTDVDECKAIVFLRRSGWTLEIWLWCVTVSNVFDEDGRTEIYQQRGNGQHMPPHAARIYMRFREGSLNWYRIYSVIINIYTINGRKEGGLVKTKENCGLIKRWWASKWTQQPNDSWVTTSVLFVKIKRFRYSGGNTVEFWM